MLTRRIATFLIGAWIGCAVFMMAITLVSPGSATDAINVIPLSGSAMLEELGTARAQELMQFQTAERLRLQWSSWEQAQMLMAGTLAFCLALSGRGRTIGLVLCAAMFGILIFQHYGVSPELMARSRTLDFTPLDGVVDPSTREGMRSQIQVYVGLETVKLLIGGVLASYLFVAQSTSRRRTRKHRSPKDVEMEIEY